MKEGVGNVAIISRAALLMTVVLNAKEKDILALHPPITWEKCEELAAESVAAVRDPEKRQALAGNARAFYASLVEMLLGDHQNAAAVAEGFGITPEEVEALRADRGEAYLPGLEPRPEKKRRPKQARIREALPVRYSPGLLDQLLQYLRPGSPYSLKVGDNAYWDIRFEVEDAENAAAVGRLEPFDQEVEAAASQAYNTVGAAMVSAEQIAAVMLGHRVEKGAKHSEVLTEAIHNSLLRLRSCFITIRGQSKSGGRFKNSGILKFDIEGYETVAGRRKVFYVFERVGLLTAVAEANGTLLSLTPEQANIEASGIRVSRESLTMRRFLLYQFAVIRRRGGGRGRVLIDSAIRFEGSRGLVEFGEDGLPVVVEDRDGRRHHVLTTAKPGAETHNLKKRSERVAERLQTMLTHFKKTGIVESFKRSGGGSGRDGFDVVLVENNSEIAANNSEIAAVNSEIAAVNSEIAAVSEEKKQS